MAKLILNSHEVAQKVTGLSVGKSRKFTTGESSSKSSHMTRTLRDSQKDECIYIRTAIMEKNFGSFVHENAVFPIEKSDEPALYEAIKWIESKAEAAMRNINDEEDKPEMRPAYSEETGTIWLKMAMDCDIFNWKGASVSKPCKTVPAKYQFVIRATQIYCGPHGSKDYKYSVLFKVAQIRFQDLKTVPMFPIDEDDVESNDDKHDVFKKPRIEPEQNVAAAAAPKKKPVKKPKSTDSSARKE